MDLRVAVLLPCYNEALAINHVIRAFTKTLPRAEIYVFDNNSTDGTERVAVAAGAIVHKELKRGKGNVVRRMFADVEADVYVMVDGDGTYDTNAVVEMIDKLCQENLDMVVGVRQDAGGNAYRKGHRWGNRMLTGTISMLFGDQFTDVLSGYRVMSRRFVKSFPALATGFEIEAMLSIYALQLGLPIAEVPCRYRDRIEGTTSKLNTLRDGFRILSSIVTLFKDTKPFVFFGFISLILFFLSLGIGLPIVGEYLQTGLVPRFPTAFLAASLMVMALISATCGLILTSVGTGRLEAKRFQYQSLKSLRSYTLNQQETVPYFQTNQL